MREWPDLTRVFEGLAWAVCGGVATRNYMPERGTQDLDVLVSSADASSAERQLQLAGFIRTGQLAIGGSTWRSPDGTPVDLIEGRAVWVGEALELAATNRDQQGLPVLTLPFLVLMKMESDRIVDAGDIARMAGMADASARDAVREIIHRYRPEFIEDLESMMTLGDLEFGSDA